MMLDEGKMDRLNCSCSGCPGIRFIGEGIEECPLETHVLLRELERTLLASRQALLCGNVAELEQLTGNQICLCRAFSQRRQRWIASPLRTASCLPDRSRAAELDHLMGSAARILQLGKVQAFLLTRMQKQLHTIRITTASREPTYSPRVTGASQPESKSEIRYGEMSHV
jgi:hypothetical protein